MRTRCRESGRLLPFLVIALFLSATIHATAQQMANEPASILSFEANRGQVVDIDGAPRPEILFRARFGGMTLYLGHDRIGYVISQPVDTLHRPELAVDPMRRTLPTSVALRHYRVDMQIVGANPAARIEREEEQESRRNYYQGGSSQGITDVRSYGRVIYRDIYPGIDLLLKG